MTEAQRGPDDSGVDIPWDQTVDGGMFRCWVEQPNAQVVFDRPEGGVAFDDRNTLGRLKVQHLASGEMLLDEDTHITAGAIFGPDAFDVAGWQGASLGAIDGWYTAHGMTPPANN